jgi:hypothetical protein
MRALICPQQPAVLIQKYSDYILLPCLCFITPSGVKSKPFFPVWFWFLRRRHRHKGLTFLSSQQYASSTFKSAGQTGLQEALVRTFQINGGCTACFWKMSEGFS